MSYKGIKFWEDPRTNGKELLEKKFYIEYEDTNLLHRKINLEFMNLNVKDHGRMWMFVVKSNDYNEKRMIYGDIVKEIHDVSISFLQIEYGYEPGVILIDSEDNLNAIFDNITNL